MAAWGRADDHANKLVLDELFWPFVPFIPSHKHKHHLFFASCLCRALNGPFNFIQDQAVAGAGAGAMSHPGGQRVRESGCTRGVRD